jgi:ATP-binding cassette subfamily B protein
MRHFQYIKQLDAMDCGPTCVRMVAKHHGKNISINHLRSHIQISKEGVSLLGISDAAEKIGFRSKGVKISYKQLIEDAPKPAILHWGQNHFVVLTPLSRWRGEGEVTIADPAKGIISYNKKEFINPWAAQQMVKMT